MRLKLTALLYVLIYPPGMLLMLSLFAMLAQAAVVFTNPLAGANIHFSAPLAITWTENDVPPPMTQMNEYEIHLCAGGQDITTMQQLAVLQKKEKYGSVNTLSVTIDPSWGGSSLSHA
jgi:hypothetical protein